MLGPYSVPRSALFCTNQKIFKTERHTRTGIEPGLTAVALAFYLHWPALRSFSRPSEQHHNTAVSAKPRVQEKQEILEPCTDLELWKPLVPRKQNRHGCHLAGHPRKESGFGWGDEVCGSPPASNRVIEGS